MISSIMVILIMCSQSCASIHKSTNEPTAANCLSDFDMNHSELPLCLVWPDPICHPRVDILCNLCVHTFYLYFKPHGCLSVADIFHHKTKSMEQQFYKCEGFCYWCLSDQTLTSLVSCHVRWGPSWKMICVNVCMYATADHLLCRNFWVCATQS